MSGGFFRGTSAEQDTRFSNKQAKLLKTQKFAAELEHLVDMTKVKMDVIKPWIAKRVTELLDGFEDEVLINLIYGLLEGKEVNGKQIQIQLTGFLEKNTGKFMKELWALLLSAQKNASGVPQQFLDAKEEETRKKKAETDRIFTEIQRRKEKENKESEQDKEKQMDDGIGNNHIEASDRRRERGSGVQSGDENGADVKNGFRGRTRASKSPSDHSQSPHRIARSRSISKSYSNSRSYSKERSLSRSVSVSPGGKGRSVSPGGRLRPPRRSITPRRQSVRESKSPRRTSLSRRRSSSRTRYRSPSPMRRRVRSPVRRSPSPFRRRSPHVRRSPSPSRRRSRSPLRRRSPPRRRWSPSPWRRRSPSPRRPRSPFFRRRRRSTSSSRSRSPAQRRSPSPFRRRFQSPAIRPSFVSRRRSPVPARLRSPSPVRRRSPPAQRRSPSPSRRRSPPAQRRSPSPSRRRSPSPSRRRSPSPALRKSSLSRGRRSPSPVDHGSFSPVRDRSPVAGRRRLPYISPCRSPSSASQSSRSPVRRTASPINKMRSPRLRKSPRGSPRVKNRDDEPAMMARKQPISLSPQRDHSNRKDSRRKVPSVSPSPEKLPYVVSPHVQTRSSGEDRRLASPRSRAGEKMALNGGRSPSRLRDMREQRNRHGSPKITEDKIENDREYEDKKKLDERKSGNLSVGKQRESPNQPMRNRHRNSVDATEADNEIISEVASLKEVRASKRSPCRGSLSGEKLENVSKLDEKRKPQLKDVRDTTMSDTLVISQKKRRSPTVDSDSGSEESQKHRTEVSEKRKHRKSRRKEVESDDTSSESEIEDRKEAKRRKKEERKLRKEERRRRREERRRKREEKRASKRKRKSKDADALSSDLENNGKHSNVSNGERLQKKYSSEEDTELQKKRLEIELREKALESLRAKKGIDR